MPTYPTPEQAIRGFMHAVNHARGQRILLETPELAPEAREPEMRAVADILARARAAGRPWLDSTETRAVLKAYGFAVIDAAQVATPEEAGAAATRIGGAVALKIVSPDIPHKTDFGGVVLDLIGAEATRAAAEAMRASIRARLPEARIEGFSVERMVHRPGAYELILGMSPDPQFGPVLVFGHGGTATETIADTALALPPLNLHLARALISRTRIARLLGGARGMPGADLDAIALALVNLSQLVCDFGEIAELDINPLLADATGRHRARCAHPPRRGRGAGNRPAGDQALPARTGGRRAASRRSRAVAAPGAARGRAGAAARLRQADAGRDLPALLRAAEGAVARDGHALHADRLRPPDGADPDRARRPGHHRVLRLGEHRLRPGPAEAPSTRSWCATT